MSTDGDASGTTDDATINFFANRKPKLEPDHDQLARFVTAMFKHASGGTFVSLRAFYETDSAKPFQISAIKLNGDLNKLITNAMNNAKVAANARSKVVFAPPISTFTNHKHAREIDLAEGLALSVECDKRTKAAKDMLQRLLGEPTVVVASGGEWTNPETGEIEPKLHTHYRLQAPARSKEQQQKLKLARRFATKLVGGDASNVPMVHPIRWPGSWHRKAQPKLCQIVSINPDREINLDTVFDILRKATATNGDNDPFATLAKEQQHSGESYADLITAVLIGESYHDPLMRLSAKLIHAGMQPDAAGCLLRDWMEASLGCRDERWKIRVADIPRCISTALSKYGPAQKPQATAEQVQTDDDPTTAPVDLLGKFNPPQLPRGLLPSVIEEFAFAQAETMGCDPNGLAMAALTVCASAIRNSIKLRVKPLNSWTEEAILWSALVGDPSSLKTPVMSTAAAPLVRIDTELWRGYLADKERYEQLDDATQKTTPKPQRRRLRLDDTTCEGAQDVMRCNPQGTLLLQDELSGWFGSMEKYSGTTRGGAKDRGFWLRVWNGGSYAVDRIKRGEFLIEDIGTSLLGGIQPDVIRRVANDTYDDGLIQRLLPIVLRPATLGNDEPNSRVVDDYTHLVERLYARHPNDILMDPFTAFANEHAAFNAIEFDHGAQVVRREMEQKHLQLMMLEGINKKLAAHIGKYNGVFARLCLIFHCIEHAPAKLLPGLIEENTARRVAKFLHGFLFGHALAFYAGVLGLADDHDRLAAVTGYILARKLDRITNRDVQRGDRTMRRLTRWDTERVFQQLEALGWLEQEISLLPGEAPKWNVNPEVHKLYAKRAADEAARRSEARRMIADMVEIGRN
jgi:uncharacterized protein DUF3987